MPAAALAPHGAVDDGGVVLSLGLAEVASVWPVGASMAAALAARELAAGRRRAALNAAVHEVRRPLQALALATPEPRSPAAGSLQLAATALERLEREINGESTAPLRGPVEVDALLAAAAERWRSRALLGGGSLALRESSAGAVVIGDRWQLAQALDNLIVNAIEHGGPEIGLGAATVPAGLRIVVSDGGGSVPGRPRRRANRRKRAIGGRRRHGHGLRIVRRIATEHGGRFQLRCLPHGAEAILELPCRLRPERGS